MPCVGEMTIQPLDSLWRETGTPYVFNSSFLIESRGQGLKLVPSKIARSHGVALPVRQYLDSKDIAVKGYLYTDDVTGATLDNYFTQLLAFWNSTLLLNGRAKLILPRDRFLYVAPKSVMVKAGRGDSSTRSVEASFLAADPFWYDATGTTWTFGTSLTGITGSPSGQANVNHWQLTLDPSNWPAGQMTILPSGLVGSLTLTSTDWTKYKVIEIDAYHRTIKTGSSVGGSRKLNWSLYKKGAFFPLIGNTTTKILLLDLNGISRTPLDLSATLPTANDLIRGAYTWFETIPATSIPTGPAVFDQGLFDVGLFG